MKEFLLTSLSSPVSSYGEKAILWNLCLNRGTHFAVLSKAGDASTNYHSMAVFNSFYSFLQPREYMHLKFVFMSLFWITEERKKKKNGRQDRTSRNDRRFELPKLVLDLLDLLISSARWSDSFHKPSAASTSTNLTLILVPPSPFSKLTISKSSFPVVCLTLGFVRSFFSKTTFTYLDGVSFHCVVKMTSRTSCLSIIITHKDSYSSSCQNFTTNLVPRSNNRFCAP